MTARIVNVTCGCGWTDRLVHHCVDPIGSTTFVHEQQQAPPPHDPRLGATADDLPARPLGGDQKHEIIWTDHEYGVAVECLCGWSPYLSDTAYSRLLAEEVRDHLVRSSEERMDGV